MNMDVYRQKPLRVHGFLAGIPLRTLERVELPGGREGMTIEDISGVVGFGGEVEMEVGPVTQALFRLRTLIGRILRWDEAKELVESVSFISRLNEEDRARSLIVPGKPVGISRILYRFKNETLGEIINRTVHCFWLMATERTANGYALWFAVYVKKLNCRVDDVRGDDRGRNARRRHRRICAMACFTPAPPSLEPVGMDYGHYDRRVLGLGDRNGAEHADGVESKCRIIAAARNERCCKVCACVGDGGGVGDDPRRAAMACAAPLCLRSVAVGVGECGGVGGRDAGGLHRRRRVAGRRIGAERSVDSSCDYCRRRSFRRRDSRRGAAVAVAPAAGRSEPRD